MFESKIPNLFKVNLVWCAHILATTSIVQRSAIPKARDWALDVNASAGVDKGPKRQIGRRLVNNIIDAIDVGEHVGSSAMSRQGMDAGSPRQDGNWMRCGCTDPDVLAILLPLIADERKARHTKLIVGPNVSLCLAGSTIEESRIGQLVHEIARKRPILQLD